MRAMSGPAGWAIPLLAGLGAIAIGLISPQFPIDDAYITLHNARSLIAGGDDPVYGGNAVVGATSLVHLALLAGLGLLMPLPMASHVLGVAAVVLYALGLVRLADRHGVSPWAVAGPGLLTAYVPFALTNGLESGLAMAAVVWLMLFADRRGLGWVAGISAFVRPELALLAGMLGLARLWQLRDQPRAAAELVGTGLLAAAPLLLWAWLATGAIVPSTGGAKLAFFASLGASAGDKVQVAWRSLQLSLLLPLALCAPGLLRMRGGVVLLAWALLWLAVSTWSLPIALSHNKYRYLTALVPVLMLGWIGLATLPALQRHRLWRWAMPLLAIGCTASGVIGLRNRFDDATMSTRYAQLAADARTCIPAGARVLVHDAGYLAWARPDLRLVDIVGLKSPASIPFHQRLTATRQPGAREQALRGVAQASGASHLVELGADRFWSQTSRALREGGWQVTQCNAAEAPAGLPALRYYHILRIAPPDQP